MTVEQLEDILSEVLDYADKDSEVRIIIDTSSELVWVETEAGEVAFSYHKLDEEE